MEETEINRYFMPAVLAKLGGTIGFVLIYTFYYAGGDTTMYHDSASSVIGLIPQDVGAFFEVWLGENTANGLLYFDAELGKPKFWGDVYAFNVVRYTVPFELLTFNSYSATSLLIGIFSFTGTWQLYKMFASIYPAISKWLAIAIFVRSVTSFSGVRGFPKTHTPLWLCAGAVPQHISSLRSDERCC